MDDDMQKVIAALREQIKRLEKECNEYIRAEEVLIAAGHVRKHVVEQAHEIVRSLP